MKFHGTTVVGVRREGTVAVAGDGQVTLQEHVILKQRARKVRRLYGGRVLAGFAGSVADAITLFEKFEGRLDEFHGNLQRAAVELAKEWRTDRMLRRLEALLLAADLERLLVLSGNGDVIEPDDDVVAIGSGGSVAMGAARALCRHTSLAAGDIAAEALHITADICVYTNHELVVEILTK